jgi:hypothetical protein
MLTPRDKKIIRFMEDINLGLTIEQAALMFFPKKFAYDYARQRLKKLWSMGATKRYANMYTNELIYYLDKKPSYHNNAILNVYSCFVAAGYKITSFKPEQQWMDNKYRSDGLIIAENENEIRIVIIEVDHSSTTNLNKYEELYETGELQRLYGDFPMVLILSNIERSYKSESFTVIGLDMRCTNFFKVLI